MVTLHMEALCQTHNMRSLKRALKELPSEIWETYDAAVSRIRSQWTSELGLKILMWISTALRPLTLAELKHAIAIEREDRDFNDEGLSSDGVILSACAGLLVQNPEDQTIRLIRT
jgi:hypothetical protein